VLFGISGGTVTGLTMLRAAPGLFAAYVGNGQVVNWAAQEAESYRLVLARARAAGDAEAVKELEGVGPPPWADLTGDFVKSKYCNALTDKEQAAFAAVAEQVMKPPPGAAWVAPTPAIADPRVRGAATFAAIKPELSGFDAAALGMRYDLPMVLLQGAEDLYTVTSLAVAWHEALAAPAKARALIEGAGHGSSFLAGELLELLKTQVRPLLRADS
jgi:pimeloyl-ACP methyl ester carboxylesterase